MSDFISQNLIFIIAAAAIFVVVRRWQGEPLQAQELFLPPLFLVGYGTYKLIAENTINWTATDITWLVVACAVGLLLGAVRGATIKLFNKEGVLWYKYTGKTFIVFAISAAASFAIAILSTNAGIHEETRSITLSIGVSFLGEVAVIGYSALKSGVPFAKPKERQ